MSFLRTIGWGVAWSTSGAFVSKTIAFGNIFIILSHLTVYEYGLTELTMSVVAVVGLTLLPGLVPIVTADLGVERARREYGKMKALFLEFFTFSMAAGILAWAFLFFGSSIVAHWTGNDLIDRFFKIVAFLFLTGPLRVVTTMLATVTVRYADQSLYAVVEELAKGVWLLIFFYTLGRGADGLLYALVLSQVVAILVFSPRTFTAIREFWSAKADPVPFGMLLREHRKWGVASSYVGTLSSNLRLWFIKFFLGTEAVGLFSFAFGIMSNLNAFLPLGNVMTSLVPQYVDRRSDLARLLRGALKLQTIMAVGIIVFAAAVMPVVIYLLFPKYVSTIPLVLVLLCVMLPSSVGSIVSPVFVALKEQRSQFSSAIIRCTSVAVLMPVFILLFGFLGGGLEVIATTLITVSERLWRLHRLLPEFSVSLRSMSRFDDSEARIVRLVLERVGLTRFAGWFRL